jgi:hypothetical protein
MQTLARLYSSTAPELFWPKVRERGALFWQRIGAPNGRRAEFEARLERKLRARLLRRGAPRTP